jgi:prephenate dehydrogenase
MDVENYYRKNVKKSLEGKKKVLPLHPLSGTERRFNLLKTSKQVH